MIFTKEKLKEAQSFKKISECSDARISKMLKFICITIGAPKTKIYGNDGDIDEMEIFYTQVKNLPYTPEYIEMAFTFAVQGKFNCELRLFDKNISTTFISEVVKSFHMWYAPQVKMKKEDENFPEKSPEEIKKSMYAILLDLYNSRSKGESFSSPIGLRIYTSIFKCLSEDYDILPKTKDSKFQMKFDELMDVERATESKRLKDNSIMFESKDLHEANRESKKVKSFVDGIPGADSTYNDRVRNRTCKFFVDAFYDDLIESGKHINDLIEN